ncbi:MAG: response regulator transcription factor [Vicingaceae bacterium]
MKDQKANILLVEDDTNLGFVIQDNLRLKKYAVSLYTDGKTALTAFLNQRFDVCILDVMLPKKDGFELAAEIRELNGTVPIIFLTAKTMTEDKIRGFKIGGDDYITKPFDFEELLLRIEAILKRTIDREKSSESALIFKIGNYSFDSENQLLTFGEDIVKLTKKERDLLKLLCLQQGKILSRELTLKTIWGNDDYFSGRSMDVFISKLRKYLRADERIKILNVHGVGFKMIVEE